MSGKKTIYELRSEKQKLESTTVKLRESLEDLVGSPRKNILSQIDDINLKIKTIDTKIEGRKSKKAEDK